MAYIAILFIFYSIFFFYIYFLLRAEWITIYCLSRFKMVPNGKQSKSQKINLNYNYRYPLLDIVIDGASFIVYSRLSGIPVIVLYLDTFDRLPA